MKLILKSVSYSAAMSDETSCFSATVCIDGAPAFVVSNRGQGGCDEFAPLPGQSYPDMRAAVQRVQDHAKTVPPYPYKWKDGEEIRTMMLDYDADLLIADALDKWRDEKEAKSLLRRTKVKVLVIDGTELRQSISLHTSPPDKWERAKAFFRSKYPGAVILNDLKPAEALAKLLALFAAQREAV